MGREKWGEESGGRKVGRDEESGARKVELRNVGHGKWGEKSGVKKLG